MRDGGEVRPRVAAQGDERHLLLARPRDGPTAADAARVGEQHDPQKHRGRVGRRPRRVVSIPGVERRQIDGLLEQVVQGMLEGGVPIMKDGACLGAVGVSGVKSSEDAQIAKAGIAAIGL